MLKRGKFILLFLILASSVFALQGDFNSDGDVNFDDFLLFAQGFNEFNKNGSYSKNYDLNNDSNITIQDFFIFANNYGTTENNGSNLSATKPIALTKPINLDLLDVNKDSCVDQEDLDFVNLHINLVAEKLLKMGEFWEITPEGFFLNSQNQRAQAINSLLFQYDFNPDGYVVTQDRTRIFLDFRDSDILRNNFNCVNKNKNYGICESYFGDERNKCLILLASNTLDNSFCDHIEDSELNEINLKKVCLNRFTETQTALGLSKTLSKARSRYNG